MKGDVVKIASCGCGKEFSTPEELAAWKRRDEARAAEAEAFEAFMAAVREIPYDDQAVARATVTHSRRLKATERAYLEAHGPRCKVTAETAQRPPGG